MTKREYERLYAEARRTYPKLTRLAMRKMAATYKDASDQVAATIQKATLAGNSKLTIESMAAIEAQLEAGARAIAKRLEEITPGTIDRAMALTGDIHTEYMKDALTAAGGLSLLPKVTGQLVAVREAVLRSVVNRVYKGGYTYSDAIWKVGAKYQGEIKNILSAGIAQGRDMIKIARDIQVYTAEGKIALAKRLGKLDRPAQEFMNRIGNKVDYRALRLVRTELYQAIQDADKEFGHKNPACTDMYDWVVEQGRQQWSCECDDLGQGGPYAYNDIPNYPHPNCSCSIRAVLRDGKEFLDDLKRFIAGDPVDYLDEWARVAQMQ